MPKRSIRTQLLAERKSQSSEDCLRLGAEIQGRLLRSNLFRQADCLALYSAVHNEVQTGRLLSRALDAGKTPVFPRIDGEVLEFVEVLDPVDLVPGSFGVMEPQGDKLVSPEELDLIIVPGIAFDRSGHRLGYGRGFYDRALALCRADCLKVGFAYEFQLVEALPVAEHDQRLSLLMTESRMLDFRLATAGVAEGMQN